MLFNSRIFAFIRGFKKKNLCDWEKHEKRIWSWIRKVYNESYFCFVNKCGWIFTWAISVIVHDWAWIINGCCAKQELQIRVDRWASVVFLCLSCLSWLRNAREQLPITICRSDLSRWTILKKHLAEWEARCFYMNWLLLINELLI